MTQVETPKDQKLNPEESPDIQESEPDIPEFGFGVGAIPALSAEAEENSDGDPSSIDGSDSGGGSKLTLPSGPPSFTPTVADPSTYFPNIPDPPDEFGDATFDVQAMESPAAPGPDFDPSLVKERVARLVAENTTPIRAGRAQVVALAAARPDHYDAADLKREAEKPIDWLFKDLCTMNSKILLASEPKAGKTWIVCAVALAMASGTMLFDRIEVVQPGPVGIIAAEDEAGEIGRRFDRMCRATGLVMSNLDLHWWSGDMIRLNRPRDTDWIEEQVKKYGIKLMIYDPLARLMDGDENSKECVSGVLTPASSLVKSLGCNVMLVHHLGKDDPDKPKTAAQRVRGSSDIRSWYTTGLFLSGQLDQGQVQMEVEQRVRGRLPNDFPIRAVEIEEQSVYGLGTLKLVAKVEKDQGIEGNNEQLIETASRKIMDLARNKPEGITTSEISVNLRIGRTLMNAALKRLIREEGSMYFEKADDIPDGKILIPVMKSRRPDGFLREDLKPPPPDKTSKRKRGKQPAEVVEEGPPETSEADELGLFA